MSAERLRQAAALMRSRADVWEYHRGPWRTTPGYAGHTVVRCDTDIPADEFGPGGSADTFVVDCDTSDTSAHIASWHPLVALAVAGWLERSAYLWEYGDIGTANKEHALAVANAYLGSDQ